MLCLVSSGDRGTSSWRNCFSQVLQTQQAEASATRPSAWALEIDAYFREPTQPEKFDPLEFWRDRQREFPTLAKLARKYLATPATSVYSERLFSEYGNIYEQTRSRLLPRNGEKILFLHHNLKRLAK